LRRAAEPWYHSERQAGPRPLWGQSVSQSPKNSHDFPERRQVIARIGLAAFERLVKTGLWAIVGRVLRVGLEDQQVTAECPQGARLAPFQNQSPSQPVSSCGKRHVLGGIVVTGIAAPLGCRIVLCHDDQIPHDGYALLVTRVDPLLKVSAPKPRSSQSSCVLPWQKPLHVSWTVRTNGGRIGSSGWMPTRISPWRYRSLRIRSVWPYSRLGYKSDTASKNPGAN